MTTRETGTTAIIAHRGASHDAPENTLASVRLGFEQGADAVEIDVRLSRDGAVVLMHDVSTGRTTGVDKPVAEQSLRELQSLDAGRWKAAEFTGEPIPTLDEVIAAVPPGRYLVIEVKCGPEIVPALVQLLNECGKPGSAVHIIGFDYETLRDIKRALPDVEAYLLSGFAQDAVNGTATPTAAELIERARSAGFDGLNLSHQRPVDADFVRQIHAAGLKCLIWTVDDPEEAQRFLDAGVDGITTNRPAHLLRNLKRDPLRGA